MKRIFWYSIVLMSFISCKREKVDYLGPAFVAAPEGFSVTNFTTSTPSVDFTSGNVKFNADFSSSVTWTLTIKGETSGAVHEISGMSGGLDDVTWTGAMDGAQFFKVNEKAKATLSFFGSSLTQSVEVTITAVPDYRTCPGVYFAKDADFDLVYDIKTAATIGWNGFNILNPNNVPITKKDTGVFNVRQARAVEGGTGINALQYDRNGKLVNAPQGKGYYYIVGKGDQSVFVSGLGFGTYAMASSGMYKNLPDNPNEIWVNIYLYGSGDPNAQAQLEFQEASPTNSANGANPVATEDNYWQKIIPLTHTGWKLFSFKYSDLLRSSNKLIGGNGSGIVTTKWLWGYAVVLLKNSNPDQPVELFMDYPIITIGAPFKPCK